MKKICAVKIFRFETYAKLGSQGLFALLLVACVAPAGKREPLGTFKTRPHLNFIVAGQSNSVSPGNGRTHYSTTGLVTINDFYHGDAFRIPTQSNPIDSGLAWVYLGDLFATPIRFTSVGKGNTSTTVWRQTYYPRILDWLAVEKFDALLWVQGESDRNEHISENESYENLKWLILESRKVQPGLIWFVALDLTRSSQMRIINEGLAEPGPDIDKLRETPSYFESSLAEFVGEGFAAHAKAWFDVLQSY